MKALVYTGPKQIDYRDTPDAVAADGNVRVQVSAVGICGSDMHAYLGHDERRPAPLILGHEAMGIVMDGAKQGRRVVVNPLVTCGVCRACTSGRENLCAHREIISMAPRQGAFAEQIAIPQRNLIDVPAGLDDAKAALAEPIATGWHAVKVALKAIDMPIENARALVFGGGAVGLAAALSLYATGCSAITIAETNPMRRETAQDVGWFDVVDPRAVGALEPDSFDIVIDCVGARATREAGIASVRPGGVITHVGLADAKDGIDIRRLTLQEITFIGTYTYTMQDFRDTLHAMNSGALGALDWYEERALADGSGAFDDLLNGRTRAAKIILRPAQQS